MFFGGNYHLAGTGADLQGSGLDVIQMPFPSSAPPVSARVGEVMLQKQTSSQSQQLTTKIHFLCKLYVQCELTEDSSLIVTQDLGDRAATTSTLLVYMPEGEISRGSDGGN